MRIVVQRVRRGSVCVGGERVGEIEGGLVLLVGVHRDDDEDAVRFCAEKCVHLRIFSDETGKMNQSLIDVGGAALVISQFTLYGDCRRGRRPDFDAAAHPEVAKAVCALYRMRIRDGNTRRVWRIWRRHAGRNS